MKKTAFNSIPVKRYGWTPVDDNLSHRLRCSIIAKRALWAAYNGENEPETMIADLLADLRHLCDQLGVDFSQADKEAYANYVEETGEDRTDRLTASRHPEKIFKRNVEDKVRILKIPPNS